VAYTTHAKVGEEFKNLTFSSTTFPTDTVVTRMITEADSYIDGVLSRKYETAITGVVSLLIVQQISTWIVAGRVQRLQQVKTLEPVRQQNPLSDLYQAAMDLLSDIMANKITLPDATLVSGGLVWQSESTEDPDGTLVGEFEFQKGTDDW